MANTTQTSTHRQVIKFKAVNT